MRLMLMKPVLERAILQRHLNGLSGLPDTVGFLLSCISNTVKAMAWLATKGRGTLLRPGLQIGRTQISAINSPYPEIDVVNIIFSSNKNITPNSLELA
jgi:hypothetical protein